MLPAHVSLGHGNMEFVASVIQRKWSRLTQMTWEELRARVSQAVSKRLDLTLYRAGRKPSVPDLSVRSIAHANLFGGDRKEIEHRAALLRTHLRDETDGIILEAYNICRHEFHLLGYEKLDFGLNIDWHSDPVHGKRSSPLKPWFKINFLDFREVGDHKIIWELNRHQHFVTLAKAWHLTHDPAFVNELVNQWYSWQKANPYPLGINWASALEVAFRALSWLWVRSLLAGCPDIPTSFETDILGALQLHGRYIDKYLSTYFSPNTHLLGEAVALFFMGSLCPEISAAQRWRSRGWGIVLEESKRQVRDDGVYFEQALYYHVYALDYFLYARCLASENGFVIPEHFDGVLRKMLDMVQALSEFGPPEGFGDDDGGRVFNARRNQVECMTDPLALGSIIFDCRYGAAGLTEEAIWLFGDKAVQMFGRPPLPAAAVSRAFEQGGIYLINDLVPCPQQLMIDAGPQGTGRSGHGHADALSIRFSLDGRRLLVDSGTFGYISDGSYRDLFRGTGAHNTLRVDGLDQAVSDGPFAWSSIPNVRAETWLNGQTFDFFVGSHDGYCRLPDPVLHRRSVFHIKGGLWFVHDVAQGKGDHLLESFWHFAPELKVREERGIIFAEASAVDDNAGHIRMALFLDRSSSWITEISEGLVSRAYGSKQAAPVVRSRANTTLPEDCGILLVPTTRTSDVGRFTSISENRGSGVRGYRYEALHSAEFIFLAQGDRPWACGPWTCDANLLYCKLDGGRLAHVIMVSGSFAEWRGKRLLSPKGRTDIYEWVRSPESINSSSSECDLPEEVVVDFEFLDFVP